MAVSHEKNPYYHYQSGSGLHCRQPIAALFSPGNTTIFALARSGFVLFTTAFILNGFNILITAYYTSIGNARTSAIIAALRRLILINIFILALPILMGNTGIWVSYPLAELVTLAFALAFLRRSWHGDLDRLSGDAYRHGFPNK